MPRGKKTCPSCKSIVGARASSCECEIHAATKVFECFKNDTDFLSKVKPPFVFKNTIKYFLTKDGKEYLQKKHKEFYYKPPEKDKFVDTGVKSGEDTLRKKPKTLRDFLND